MTLPGRISLDDGREIHPAGWASHGRVSAEEIIGQYRERAARQLAEAQAILAASDADFRVEQHRGEHVVRNRTVLQEGRQTEG